MSDEQVRVPGMEREIGSDPAVRRHLAERFDCDPTWLNDDTPRQRFATDDFSIDRYPVTNAQYAEFVRAAGFRAPWKGGAFSSDLADHPVVCVSQPEAAAYAAWAGKRLPSEQEWTLAAAGPADPESLFPWGEEWPGPIRREGRPPDFWDSPRTQPVSAGAVSAAGMAGLGIVCEHVSDTLPHHGGTFNQVKGASWFHRDPLNFRASAGGYVSQGFASPLIGFRCVRDARTPAPSILAPPARLGGWTPQTGWRVSRTPNRLHGVHTRPRKIFISVPRFDLAIQLQTPEIVCWNDRMLTLSQEPRWDASDPLCLRFRLELEEAVIDAEFPTGEDWIDQIYTIVNRTGAAGEFGSSSCLSLLACPGVYDCELRRTSALVGGQFVPLRRLPREGECVKWITGPFAERFGRPGDPAVLAVTSSDGRYTVASARADEGGRHAVLVNTWYTCLHTDSAVTIPARASRVTRQRFYFMRGGLDALLARLPEVLQPRGQ